MGLRTLQLHCGLVLKISSAYAQSEVTKCLPSQVRDWLLPLCPQCCRCFHTGLRGEAASAPGVRAGALHRWAGPRQSGLPIPSQSDLVRLGDEVAEVRA